MTAATNEMTIAVMAGEGIGIEVTAQAVRVLEWFTARRALPVQMTSASYGLEAYRATGEVLPDSSRKIIDAADAILFGATGGAETKEVPIAARKKNTLLKIRKSLDLFANLRPIKTVPALYEASPLKARVLEGVDMIIVRELSSGIYFGEPRGIETLPDGSRRGFNTTSYTTAEIERVVRYSFELARTRRGQLCSVDKANVMETGVLWREIVEAIHAEEYSDIELSHMHVDNAAMQVVRAPAQFDVIVTDNIFGDILSDAAAVAAGSLGMLPSAALGPADAHGRRKAIYEPVHGSAPDIAGKGIANPLGSILSVAMMLRSTLGRPDDAALLEQAVEEALTAGARTADIAEPGVRPGSTTQMGDAVLEALDKRG